MAELLRIPFQPEASSTEVAVVLPTVLYDPRTGYPVGPDSYVSGCMELLADPAPTPEMPTTAELAAPLVQQFLTSPWIQRRMLATLLNETYAPITPEQNGTTSQVFGGPRNEEQARRNFVAYTLHAAQQAAIEQRDTDLAGLMTTTACGVLDQEFARLRWRNRSPKAADPIMPGLLVQTVQAAAEHHLEPSRRHNMPPGSVPEHPWLMPEDFTHLRDTLASLTMIDQLNLRHEASVDLLLSSYHLNPVVMRRAWRRGFPNSRPEEGEQGIIADNLKRIIAAEVQRPGIAHELSRENFIRCFGRYSVDTLVYLDEQHEAEKGRSFKISQSNASFSLLRMLRGTDSPTISSDFWAYWDVVASTSYLQQYETPAEEPSSATQISYVITAGWDGNGALRIPGQYDPMMRAARKSGHRIEFYECASQAELTLVIARIERRKIPILSILANGHSADGFQFVLGGPENSPNTFSTDDLEANDAAVREFFKDTKTVALRGCSTGVDRGFADTVKLARVNMPVDALPMAMAAKLAYSNVRGLMIQEYPEDKKTGFRRATTAIGQGSLPPAKPYISRHVKLDADSEYWMNYISVLMSQG